MLTAAPPPPTGSIVFDRVSSDGQREQLYRGRADGTGVFRLTRSGRYWWEPRWSPDGTQLAAFNDRSLAILTPAGRVVRRLRGSATRLTWSPDGTRFGYVVEHCIDQAGHEDPGCGTLWVVRTDGSERRRLSPEDAVPLGASFGD